MEGTKYIDKRIIVRKDVQKQAGVTICLRGFKCSSSGFSVLIDTYLDLVENILNVSHSIRSLLF